MNIDEMRDYMLKNCRKHLAVWFSYREGDDAIEVLKKQKTRNERIQFGIRMILLMMIPKMTEQSHRLSEFKEDLPLLINLAPEIVRDVLTERYDYSFGYHCKDVAYTFDQISWREHEKTEGGKKG